MPIEFNKLLWYQELPKNKITTVISELQDILTTESSLTKLLKKRYNNDLELSVLRNEWQNLTLQDINFLKIPPSNGIIREVIIKSKGDLIVFARCCIPASTFCKDNKELLLWNDKPIGEFIFSQQNYSRSKFQYSYIPLGHFNEIIEVNNSQKLLWIRRSTIKVNLMPILIYEVFLR